MKKRVLQAVFVSLLISGGLMSEKVVEASTIDTLSTNTVNEIIDDIRSNTSEEDFKKLESQYNFKEMIEIIDEEISESLGNLSQELIIDLDSNQRLNSKIETFDLTTESGYNFTVISEVTPEPSMDTRASTTITGNYDSTFNHTVSVKVLGGLAGTATLTTKIKVSPGKISYVSSTPTCEGLALVYCDQGQKTSSGSSYTMPGTYSSFQSNGLYVFRGDFSILGSLAYTHKLTVRYGCTAYNNTTKKVTIKVQY